MIASGVWIVLALAALAASVVAGPRWPRLWLACSLASAVALLGAAAGPLGGGAAWEWRSAFALGGERVHLRLDALSAWFLALLAVAGAAGATFAMDGAVPAPAARAAAAGRGRAWWGVLGAGMVLVLLNANGLHFLIAWEIFALAAYFLITLERERAEVRAAGWLYLGASHAGTLILFAFFALLAERTGSWELGPFRERAELAPLLWLALLGFGVKAGMFPLHVWLPSAHANAPSQVSAILSGVAIKIGLYGILRFTGWLPAPAALAWVVLALGAASAVLGAAFSFAQNDLKRLLAYCSVENMGVILIGLGAALLAAAHGNPAWGRLALAGALLHVWNHGLFKSLLFLAAGSVLHGTGTRDLSRLGGLWRRMPWTTAAFAFGALAIAALPPLNGFVSEWLIYLGLLDAAAARGPALAAAAPAAIALAVAGALALASFVKAGALAFLGAPRSAAAASAHEGGGWLRAPLVLLAVLCLLLALAPEAVGRVAARPLAAWNPSWSGAESVAALPSLGAWQRGLALALVAAAGGAVFGSGLLAGAGRLRRAPTWGCGYARPESRMQYSAGSFSAIATGWFRWILRPLRRLRRPRGLFPAQAEHLERIPETVLEHLIEPAAGFVMVAAAWVRRRQHGRLQFYILYLVAGLAAVGALALSWSLG